MERTNKDVCLLCQVDNADKKGSHIIPAFLISTAISHKGSKKRDMELMSIIKNSGFTETFIGRNVLPEAIAEVKEKALTEEEVIENVNPNIKDFYFCSNCEKRFSIIENLFSEKINASINKYVTSKSYSNYQLKELKNADATLTKVFFLSIVWRIAISKNIPLNLPDKVTNKLRVTLNTILKDSTKELEEILFDSNTLIDTFPFAILHLPENRIDSTKSMILATSQRFPHFISLNRFIILFFEKPSHISNTESLLFGFRQQLNLIELVNTNQDFCTVGVLSEECSDMFRKEVLHMLVNEMRETIRLQFSYSHEAIFGFRPPHDVIYALTHRIVQNKKALYDKHTLSTSINIMAYFIMDLLNYIDQHGYYPRFKIGDVLPENYKLP